MPTTPVYGLRYPAATDPADVPTDMNELATDVETALDTKGHGVELGYTQFTADVAVSALTEATANTVVTCSAVTFDGTTPVFVEFYAYRLGRGTAGFIQLSLFDGGASIGVIALYAGDGPCFVSRRLTPSAGSHTYSIRAFVNTASGTVFGGVGGAGASMPGFIRIRRA